jgi:hypothetical protein
MYEPKDTDYLVEDPKEWKKEKGVEYFPIPPGLEMKEVISPNEQYTLTCSHLIRNLKGVDFNKHVYTLQFLKDKGCELIPELLSSLLLFWNDYHGPRRIPNFDQPNEAFFKDRVEREMNHDELHEYFKFYEKPLFTYIKFDQSKAAVEEILFNRLSFEDRIKTVLEELFVVSFERDKDAHYRAAYMKTLRWLIHISPEWFSIFILDNYTLISQYATLWKSKRDQLLTNFLLV